MERFTVDGVTLVGSRDADIAFGFTERTGGVSKPPYASLNLGSHVGDDLEAVQHNRLLALRALGVENLYNALIIPNQVHGDDVVVAPHRPLNDEVLEHRHEQQELLVVHEDSSHRSLGNQDCRNLERSESE